MNDSHYPCVVAMGASAGGLSAFQQLIENLPVDTGMAFVLLSHVLRGSKSMLAEILAQSTAMPVLQVTHGRLEILGDHIYVLPPDKFMEIDGNSLLLIERPNTPVNNAIDHFLFSLAKDQAHRSIGIVLSGEGSDGAEGLKILKEQGGVTMAQAPDTAFAKSMPINAIEIDHVDYVLSPKAIAEQVASSVWCSSYIAKSPFKVLWSSTTAASTDPYTRLGAICARAGLDLALVDPKILGRMRLLATSTEILRDCERCSDLAEEFFRHDDVAKAPRERFTPLERRTVVIGTLFSDIGKSGPDHADARGRRLVAEMYGVENGVDGRTSVAQFFNEHFPADAADRVRRFHALGLQADMSMREFWNLHSVWTLQILRGDGVPPEAVKAAAAHHLVENINPHAIISEDSRLRRCLGEGASFERADKLVIVLDKYDAARRRGGRSHDGAIAWLRQLIAGHPRFRDDQGFVELIQSLDAVVKHRSTGRTKASVSQGAVATAKTDHR